MIKPIGDKVVVLPAPKETKTLTGIYIPEIAQESKSQGTVVAAGPGSVDQQTGRLTPTKVKPGDTIWYNKGCMAMEVDINGEPHIIIQEREIFAIL